MPSSSAIVGGVQRRRRRRRHSSASSRGSTPRSTVITRSARTISALATRRDALGALERLEARARRPSAADGALAPPRGRARSRPPSGAPGAEQAEHQVGVGDGRLGAAVAVAGRARAARPPSAGPTRSAPPASRQAIEPPPAPTVWMSSIGSATGRPPTSRRRRLAHARRPAITQTSHDVPPMSKHERVGLARRARGPGRAGRAAGRAGEHGQRGVRAPRARALARPPRGLHHVGLGQPGLARRARRARAGRRASRGERAASTSVVAARSYSRNVPTTSCESETCTPGRRSRERSAERLLVLGVAVGVQQADGDGLGLEPGDRADAAAARRRSSSQRPVGPIRSRRADAPLGRHERRRVRARTAGRGRRAPGGRARRRPRSPRWRRSAVRAPSPSSSALVATVVPCANASTSSARAPRRARAPPRRRRARPRTGPPASSAPCR